MKKRLSLSFFQLFHLRIRSVESVVMPCDETHVKTRENYMALSPASSPFPRLVYKYLSIFPDSFRVRIKILKDILLVKNSCTLKQSETLFQYTSFLLEKKPQCTLTLMFPNKSKIFNFIHLKSNFKIRILKKIYFKFKEKFILKFILKSKFKILNKIKILKLNQSLLYWGTYFKVYTFFRFFKIRFLKKIHFKPNKISLYRGISNIRVYSKVSPNMLKFEFFQNKQISLYRGICFKVFNFVRFFKNQFLNKLYFILLSNFKNLLLKSGLLHSGVLLGGYTKSPPIALHPPRPLVPVALGGCGQLVALPHFCPLARPRSPPFDSRKVFTPWMVLSGLNTPLKT